MTDLKPVTCSKINSDDRSLVHGFFTRQGGVSSGIYQSLNIGPSSADDAQNVRKNRRAILDHLKLAGDDIITPWQIHSTEVLEATGPWQGDRPKGDAIVTNRPNIAIGIVTADCGPVLFSDPKNKVIGAAHAGWRGATEGILEATIDKMLDLGAEVENIQATLGPTISGENYEVGPEFIENLHKIDPSSAKFLSPSPRTGHAMFDLPHYIIERLQTIGVSARWTGQCTYADEARFFSYRRTTHKNEPDYGRQISAIGMKHPT